MAASNSSALLLVAVLAVFGQCATSRKLAQAPQQTLTGMAIVLHADHHGKPTQSILAVRTPSGQRVRVELSHPSQLAGVQTGMSIEATGEWQQPAKGSSSSSSAAVIFKASTVRASAAAFAAPRITSAGDSSMVSAAAATGYTPVWSTNKLVARDLSTLVIPIAGVANNGAACPGTSLPKLTAAQVKHVVFAESNPAGATVGSTFNKCSYGKTRLTARNSLVADTVRLGCAGTTNGVAWSMSKCDFDDFNGWADAADAALRAKGVNIDKYKYKVYLVPPGVCSFVGLGYTGCDGSYECRAWIGGDFWGSAQAISHELGHNLYLAHSGSVNEDGMQDDYADSSGLMGYCCSDRCPNTPQAWQLGWISLQQLDGSSLKAGQTVRTTLASQATSARSGMRIVPSWVAGVEPIFLGYRTKAGGDAGLPPEAAGKVHVYTSAITNTYSPQKTSWKSSLAEGASWEHSTAGLVVRVKGFSRGGAVVSVCRKGGVETAASCAAGLDNDCNGLVGAQDPVCATLLRRTSALRP